jgi:hypothetical protein
MLTKISEFVKDHINDIILFVTVALLVMLSFAVGYIASKSQLKTPIQVIQDQKQ